MARLDVLTEVEKKADGYAVINTLANIALHITGGYFVIELTTYIWRKSAAERENMFSKLKCRYKGHILTQAGTCPYTGSTYDYCERCSNMIPREIAA